MNIAGWVVSGEREFRIDIQLFADPDKTERATPRRRQKAREEGQVPVSREFTSGLSFLVISVVFLFIGWALLDSIVSGTMEVLELSDRDLSSFEDFWVALSRSFSGTFLYLALIVFGAAVFALIVGLVQTKFLFTLKPLRPDLSRLNPISGLRRMFSLRSLFELAKSILKLAIIGFVGYSVVAGRLNEVLRTVYSDTLDGVVLVWDVLAEMLVKCAIALLIVSVIDFYYSRYEYEQNIKMTKYEVKEEFKEVEGNPEVKRRQRQIMMQYATRRMMQQVPEASVVITNPTHYACALRYDPERDFAPILVAKGVDRVAQRIIEVARENDVPIVRNPRLAREIYYSTDLGEAVPERLYRAVAEVLAYVYSLREVKERF